MSQAQCINRLIVGSDHAPLEIILELEDPGGGGDSDSRKCGLKG